MFDTKKSVSVIGLGYIGLPTAALLASKGYVVKGMDISEYAVETINKGAIHIVEPDLDTYVRSAVASGNLKAYEVVEAGKRCRNQHGKLREAAAAAPTRRAH